MISRGKPSKLETEPPPVSLCPSRECHTKFPGIEPEASLQEASS
jgi:hypothetical protein